MDTELSKISTFTKLFDEEKNIVSWMPLEMINITLSLFAESSSYDEYFDDVVTYFYKNHKYDEFNFIMNNDIVNSKIKNKNMDCLFDMVVEDSNILFFKNCLMKLMNEDSYEVINYFVKLCYDYNNSALLVYFLLSDLNYTTKINISNQKKISLMLTEHSLLKVFRRLIEYNENWALSKKLIEIIIRNKISVKFLDYILKLKGNEYFYMGYCEYNLAVFNSIDYIHILLLHKVELSIEWLIINSCIHNNVDVLFYLLETANKKSKVDKKLAIEHSVNNNSLQCLKMLYFFGFKFNKEEYESIEKYFFHKDQECMDFIKSNL